MRATAGAAALRSPSCSKPIAAAPAAGQLRFAWHARSLQPITSARICGQTREAVNAVPVATSRVDLATPSEFLQHFEEPVPDPSRPARKISSRVVDRRSPAIAAKASGG